MSSSQSKSSNTLSGYSLPLKKKKKSLTAVFFVPMMYGLLWWVSCLHP